MRMARVHDTMETSIVLFRHCNRVGKLEKLSMTVTIQSEVEYSCATVSVCLAQYQC